MDSISDSALEHPSWSMTFVGGTADLADQPPLACSPGASRVASGSQLPLAMAGVGDRVWVGQIQGGHRMIRRLTDLGIGPGSEITIISRTGSGSVIVALQGCRIGLGAGMAHRVMVTTTQQESSHAQSSHPSTAYAAGDQPMAATVISLGSLDVGQSGRIWGYESGSRAYRGKLLAMGLTPGTHFTVTRQAPLGDPIEIEVRGFKLSLRKGEAAALQVETVNG